MNVRESIHTQRLLEGLIGSVGSPQSVEAVAQSASYLADRARTALGTGPSGFEVGQALAQPAGAPSPASSGSVLAPRVVPVSRLRAYLAELGADQAAGGVR
ncbi:MAG: hypothetical protein JNL54_03435 [Kineosporiaceae bacterium]|nr:hypothetical protein [Kineosporiaceae bacterium]